MEASLFLVNLSSPPVLFFLLGLLATAVRSDLEIPAPIVKFLSLYLLLAIGFKGGAALASSTIDAAIVASLCLAILLAIVIPIVAFVVLRARIDTANAAAIAATYGSVSAVTFVTTTEYLDTVGVDWGGHLVAAMALMESPAILIGVLLHRLGTRAGGAIRWRELLHESCFNGPVVLIVGSLAIGWLSGARGAAAVAPLTQGLFTGVLCFFLLDMGLVAARRLRDFRAHGLFLPAFSLVFPVTCALATAAIATAAGLREGDAMLLTVLAASASYIAVPAALRLTLPEANPSIFLPMSLGLTFPFNIALGIPLYHALVRAFGG
jgi:hypothetical protein